MVADDVDLDRDRSLVARFQAGDTMAFDELYRRYFDRLVRFCQRKVDDRHEAEEIAQEAFARAWRSLPRLTGDQRFYPWLTVIASRLCVDNFRRLQRAQPVADITDSAIDGGQERFVDESVDLIHLREALSRLVPRHREVLAFREHQGWSYRQIADHYDVSMGTVEVLLFRARKALRREFLAVGGTDGRMAAGLPVLVWLRARGAGLKSRLDALWGPGFGPLGANAASFAFVIGTTAGIVSGVAAPAHPTHTPRPAVVQVATATAPIEVPVVDERATAVTEGAVRHPDAPAEPGAPLTTGSYRETAPRASQAPVKQDLGGTTAGANPGSVATDTAAAADRWLHDLELR